MHEVDSSSIRAIGYDRAGEALWVEYRSSPVRYVYFGVPPDEYRDLEAAESKGGYVNRRIKPR